MNEQKKMNSPEKRKQQKAFNRDSQPAVSGGELHQVAGGSHPSLTTNQGVALSDNQNSLRANPLGPTLLEDFILREKITHFDHERIPERIVHARATGVHGFFELTASLKKYTTARMLTEVGEKTPVFTRISTVAGGAGSVDTHVTCADSPSSFIRRKAIGTWWATTFRFSSSRMRSNSPI